MSKRILHLIIFFLTCFAVLLGPIMTVGVMGKEVVAESSTNQLTSTIVDATSNQDILPVVDFIATQTSNDPLQIELTWQYTDTTTITSFEIFRSDGQERYFLAEVEPNATSYIDSDPALRCSSYYNYTIVATVNDEISELTATKIVPRNCPELPPVSNLSASQLSDQPISIELQWSYSDPTSVDYFEIVRTTEHEPEFYDSVEANRTRYTDTSNLNCGTTYTYAVSPLAGGAIIEANTIEISSAECILPELSISNSGPTTANPGDLITYTLSVTNSGSISAPYLIIYDVLPDNAEFIRADKAGKLELDSNEVLWELGELAPGMSQQVQLTVQANQDITHTTYGVFTQLEKNVVATEGQQPVSTQISEQEPDVNVCVQNLEAPVKRFSLSAPQLVSSAPTRSEEVFEAVFEGSDAYSAPLAARKGIATRLHQRTQQSKLTAIEEQNSSHWQRARDGIIIGDVQLDDGTPVNEVEVCGYWYGYLDNKQCVKSNRQGRFRFTGLDDQAVWRIEPTSTITYTVPSDSYAYVDLYETGSPYTLTEPLIVSNNNLKGQFVLADEAQTPLADLSGIINTLNADGSINWDAPWWPFRTNEEGQFSAGTLPAGSYNVLLYDLSEELLADGYLLPQPLVFTMTANSELQDLGQITVSKATKFIKGRVMAPEKAGLANVWVSAIRDEKHIFDYKIAETDENGSYSFPVSGGTWMVEPIVLDDDLIYTGIAKTVQFSGPANALEEHVADFELTAPSQFITGRVVKPGGEPFISSTGTEERFDASVDLWDAENERYFYSWLKADGTFKVPAPDGVYEIFLWVSDEESAFAGGTIEVREVQGSNIDLGDISLVSRFATITGSVQERGSNRAVPNVFVDVWELEGRWFGTQTDADGNYRINLPPGEWQIAPYLFSDEGYIAEEGSKRVTVKASQREATVDFKLTPAEQQITGRFVNAEGELEDVSASVFLTRSPTGKRIATASVDRGLFELPLPNDCYNEEANFTCQVGVDLIINADHTIIGDPQISGNPGQQTQATFTVRENESNITGHVVDPSSLQPVNGLHGVVTLIPTGNKTAVKSASIISGSYELSQVGAGDFSLHYELDTMPEEVLALDRYLASPTFPFSVAVQESEQLTRTIILERGESFEITVTSEDRQEQITNYYPAVVSCENNIRSSSSANLLVPLSGGGGNCKRVPRYKNQCSRSGGGRALTDLLRNQAPTFNIEQHLFNDVVTQSCQVTFGNAAVNNVNQDGTYINPPAQTVNIGTNDITLSARKRNMYLVGQVRDAKGSLIRDSSVEVVAVSLGTDGQVERMTTDANGCYRLHVSQTDANWTIMGVGEREGIYQSASETLTSAVPNAQNVLFAPSLQLASTGVQRIEAESHTFDPKKKSSYGFLVGENRRVHINIPASAMPVEESENLVKLSISSIFAPDTSFDQLIGNAYQIRFVTGSKKRHISEYFRTSISVELPYDPEELAQQNRTPDDLGVAQFSYQNNHWTPVTSIKVDEEHHVVKFNLDQIGDAIALTVPTNRTDTAAGHYTYYFPMWSHHLDK